MPANPNDALRDAIVKYLYERHQKQDGTHRHETQGDRLSHDIHKLTGQSREAIAANLSYLVGHGFVIHRREPKFVDLVEVEFQGRITRPGGRQEVPGMHLYSISSTGIDHIEGGSKFTTQQASHSVTVINRDGRVNVNVGNNNSITFAESDLSGFLNALAKIIESNRDLSEAVRRDALADLETVRAQASKSKPDIGIIRTAWEGVKIAVTAGEAVILLQQAAVLLGLP